MQLYLDSENINITLLSLSFEEERHSGGRESVFGGSNLGLFRKEVVQALANVSLLALKK